MSHIEVRENAVLGFERNDFLPRVPCFTGHISNTVARGLANRAVWLKLSIMKNFASDVCNAHRSRKQRPDRAFHEHKSVTVFEVSEISVSISTLLYLIGETISTLFSLR